MNENKTNNTISSLNSVDDDNSILECSDLPPVLRAWKLPPVLRAWKLLITNHEADI